MTKAFHSCQKCRKIIRLMSVVTARLVEQSSSTPEILGSNPVIENFIYFQMYLQNCVVKTKIKKRGHFVL